MNIFPLPLHFDNAGFINGRRRIWVKPPFRAITSLGVIDITEEFCCDGGSIPKAAHSLIGDGYDEALEDFVLHDWLYSEHNTEFTRDEADFLLNETLYNRRVNRFKRFCIWSAVRLFGRPSFKAKIHNL